jgi:hypothetical protein
MSEEPVQHMQILTVKNGWMVRKNYHIDLGYDPSCDTYVFVDPRSLARWVAEQLDPSKRWEVMQMCEYK